MDVLALFQTLGAMVAGIVAVAELVDKFWNLDGVASQVRSLAIGILLGVVGAGFQLGMFADPTVLGDVAWYLGGGAIGLGAGFMANWAFATPVVLKLLELLKLRPKQS